MRVTTNPIIHMKYEQSEVNVLQFDTHYAERVDKDTLIRIDNIWATVNNTDKVVQHIIGEGNNNFRSTYGNYTTLFDIDRLDTDPIDNETVKFTEGSALTIKYNGDRVSDTRFVFSIDWDGTAVYHNEANSIDIYKTILPASRVLVYKIYTTRDNIFVVNLTNPYYVTIDIYEYEPKIVTHISTTKIKRKRVLPNGVPEMLGCVIESSSNMNSSWILNDDNMVISQIYDGSIDVCSYNKRKMSDGSKTWTRIKTSYRIPIIKRYRGFELGEFIVEDAVDFLDETRQVIKAERKIFRVMK